MEKKPQQLETHIALGNIVRDKYTGFEGVVEGITFWLHGCARICVRPPGLTADGAMKKSSDFDDQRLDIIRENGILVSDAALPANGGPGDAVSEASTPSHH